MDRLWIEGAEGRRKFLDRLTLSFFPKHADCVLKYEKAMRERNRLLKEKMTDGVWYKALESQMAKNGLLIQLNRKAALKKICASQNSSTTMFPAADLSLSHTDSDMPTDEGEFILSLSESRHLDILAGRTLIGPHRSDMEAIYLPKGIPAKDSSTGEQKAMLISIILANARALKLELGYPPIMLLDEVSAHLDADRRSALYAEINALKVQAWMTGTDKNLFSELGKDAQHFNVSETSGVSGITEKDFSIDSTKS
jgi:DNA replication and repair protein RecF